MDKCENFRYHGDAMKYLLLLLAGCATLSEPEVEVVKNSQGVEITRHYAPKDFPEACSEAEACYKNGHVYYRERYPNYSTIYHEEEGHGNGMVHGPWYSCGPSMCAVVIRSGGHYITGQIIVKSGELECLPGNCKLRTSESLVGSHFQPVDIYKLLGVKK